MFMADSFAGMPPADASSRVGKTSEGFTTGTLVGTTETVARNFVHLGGSAHERNQLAAMQSECRRDSGGGVPPGGHLLKGWFNETLPGPIERVALLRADSDLYVSLHDTLEALYPRLAPGGFVVFDDLYVNRIHTPRCY